MAEQTRFKNRVALITGAGSTTGIGFAAARTLASGGAGVAMTSTTERIYERAAAVKAESAKAQGYTADLMHRDQVKKLVDSVISDFGRIDILVNNAGMVQVGKKETFVPLVDSQLDLKRENWSTGETGQPFGKLVRYSAVRFSTLNVEP